MASLNSPEIKQLAFDMLCTWHSSETDPTFLCFCCRCQILNLLIRQQQRNCVRAATDMTGRKGQRLADPEPVFFHQVEWHTVLFEKLAVWFSSLLHSWLLWWRYCINKLWTTVIHRCCHKFPNIYHFHNIPFKGVSSSELLAIFVEINFRH